MRLKKTGKNMKRKEYSLNTWIKGRLLINKSFTLGKVKRQVLHLKCIECGHISLVRQDNLERSSCPCQSRKQFDEVHDSFIPSKNYYSDAEINEIARFFKVGKSNIIGILKKHNMSYEYKNQKTELTNKDKQTIAVCQSFGLSTDEITARVQTDRRNIPSQQSVFEKTSNSPLIDEWKELRLKGWRLREIAERFSLSVETVHQRLVKKFGTTFSDESKCKRRYKDDSEYNQFFMKSDHRLSKAVLKKRNKCV
jgi:predicted DNA-binding protein YlxM (UPF0122 family)